MEQPQDYYVHYTLGQFYAKVGPVEKSIECYERALELNPRFLGAHWGAVLGSLRMGQNERAERLAVQALPAYEKALRIAPTMEGALINYAALLQIGNRPAESLARVNELMKQADLDNQTLYAAACLYSRLGESEKGLKSLSESIKAGFMDLSMILRDPDLDSLRELPQYPAVIGQLESKQHA